MQKILEYQFRNNSVETWLIAAAVTIGTWLVLLLVRRIAARWVANFVQKTTLVWDDVFAALIPRTHWLFLLGVALFAGARLLNLPQATHLVLKGAVITLGLLQVGSWGSCVVTFFVNTHRERRMSTDPASVTTIGALGVLAQILVWALVLLVVLANAGVQIGPLVAGMGVGGIAIALAVQTVLKDLLASFSIILDKPFVLGDFLIVNDLMGSVEHIGLKTTRIRSLSGEQLVFANNDLLESRIRNFGRMRERRAVFTIGVTYDTPREKLEAIPGIVKMAVEKHKTARFDRSHFKTFSASSLDFETVFYVAVPDMTEYMNIQQSINLDLISEFAKQGIEFAFPTQTLFVNRVNGPGVDAAQ